MRRCAMADAAQLAAPFVVIGALSARRKWKQDRLLAAAAEDEGIASGACAENDHPAFAKELPRLVSEVRRMFSGEEIRHHLARLELEQTESAADDNEPDEEDALF